ncbi:AAA family ATPase [Pyrodictium abyssi]|uniref:DNA double-strand break repair Rad50 ATPase n=1 Tax=Pyrodictium abyssi TaxID=54256 RepID=A0ABN6ZMG4_9CREN|nr:DNA double-strand break repair ATPase Rad50 [Pyrodictium abyssi]
MIIERVELENVLSHRRTRVDFGRGIIAIVGPNGAGKTSIIDAITYAIFGSHSRGARSRKDALIRLGASIARISVEFTANGRRYRLQKVIQRNGATQAYLYQVGNGTTRLLARGVESVKAELRKILGIDPVLADLLLVTRQGEIDEILVDKERRIDVMNTILKLRAIEKAYERLASILRLLRAKKSMLEEQYRTEEARLREAEESAREYRKVVEELERLKPLLEEAEKEYVQLRDRINELRRLKQRFDFLNAKKEELERALRRLEQEYEEARREYEIALNANEELKELEKLEESLRLLEEALSLANEVSRDRQLLVSLRSRLERIEAELEALPEAEHAKEEYERLRAVVDELEHDSKRYLHVKSQLEQLEARARLLRERANNRMRNLLDKLRAAVPLDFPREPGKIIEKMESMISSLDKAIDATRVKLENIHGQVEAKRSEIRDLEEKLMKLTEAQGKCPLCGRPLSDEHRVELISRMRAQKKRLEAELKRLEAQEHMLRRELRDLESRKRLLERLARTVQGEAKSIELMLREADDAEKQKQELQQQYLELFAKYKEHEEARQRLRELEVWVNRYQRLRALADEYKSLEAEVTRLEKEVAEREKLLKDILSRAGLDLEGLEEVSKRISDYREYIASVRSEAARLPQAEAKLHKLEAEIDRVRSELESIVSELEEIGDIGSALEHAEARLVELEDRLRELRSRVARLEGMREKLETMVSKTEVLRSRVSRLREELQRYGDAIHALERIRRALGPEGIPRVLRQAVRNILEYHLRDTLMKFNIDFLDVRLEDDYSVVLVTREGEKTVSMLSGGERIALAIAYRLALARVVGERIESMIMDEPTIHLDEEKRRELVEIIKYGLEASGLLQLIVVTHDREIEDAADKVVEVVKVDGASVVNIRSPGDDVAGAGTVRELVAH